MTPVETPPTPEDAMSRLPQNLPETPASDGDHPRLTEAQLARLEQAGDRHPVFRGDILYRQGEPNSYFHVILFGAVAVIGSPGGSSQQVIRIHGDRRFLGELGILTGHPESGTAVVFRDGQVLRIPVAHLRTLLAKDAELRDVILRAFLVRRAMEFELTADLHILGRPNSPDIHRLQAYAHAHRLTADVVELTGGDDERLLGDLGLTGADLPLVVLRTGRVLHNPGGEEIDLTLS
jgi:CRP-like cAMP-binding protein